jgi:glycosyltransferase involved in cell wall biosynthesis
VRIVHVLTEPQGGGGVYARTLAQASVARGDDVVIAAPTPVADDLPWIKLDLRQRRVVQALRAADVVHCHGIRAGLAGFLPAKAGVVQTPHGVHQARSKEGIARLAARSVTRAILRRADLIVCVSESERAFVQSLLPSRASSLRVVLNGVAARAPITESERAAARTMLGLTPEQRVLLFVGGLRFQKNPQLAVEAAEVARHELPQLVLLMAGGGPLDSEVAAVAGPGVVLLGERQDVGELLAAADAVLNTSRWEGLSLALLEALWAGRPLVVTDAPGNEEAAGDAGFVVPNHNPSALAAAIVEALGDDNRLAELSRRARRRAETMFDDERMIAETLPLYAEARR